MPSKPMEPPEAAETAGPEPSETTGTKGAEPPKMIQKLREQRGRHLERSRPVRILYVLVGATVTLGGIAMLLLPGPAFVVIPVGLAILSLEFRWAEKAMEKAIEQGEVAKRKATETSTLQRVFTGVAAALAAAAFAVWAIWGDVPILPV